MKQNIVITFILVAVSLFATDYLDLNFFIEPQFDHDEIEMVNFLIKNLKNDSIPQTSVFAGRLFKKPQSDSSTVFLLNSIKPRIASPVDYLFHDKNLQTELLISNIVSDSIPIIKQKIIVADSFKVGMFSIYTPDFPVKYDIAKHAKFDVKIFEIAKQQAEMLKAETDFVIMLSNVSKYIDADIIRNLPVNAVVSFDYQKKRNELLNGKTMFYSILTKDGYFGKLRLTFERGKIKQNWKKVSFIKE